MRMALKSLVSQIENRLREVPGAAHGHTVQQLVPKNKLGRLERGKVKNRMLSGERGQGSCLEIPYGCREL